MNILFKKAIFLSYCLFFCFTATCFAMTVTLQWNANTEPNRAGYKIYYDIDSGPPYDGNEAVEGDSPINVEIADVEESGKARFTVTGLNDDAVYHFSVTAYDSTGNESGYSNEASTGSDSSAGNENSSGGGSGCFINTARY
jgi:hypothetical protein